MKEYEQSLSEDSKVSHLTSSYGCRRSEYKMWGLETLQSWKGSLSPYTDGQEQNHHLHWQSCSFPLLKRVEFTEAGIWDLTSLLPNAPGLKELKIDCLIPCHFSTSPLLFKRTKLRSLTLGCSRNIPPAFWVALLSACPDLESLHLFKVAARYPSRMGDHVTREQVDDIYHRINMSPDCLTRLQKRRTGVPSDRSPFGGGDVLASYSMQPESVRLVSILYKQAVDFSISAPWEARRK